MTPSRQRREGLIERIGLELQIIPRLFVDRRMPLWLKLVPAAAAAFLVNPVDFPGLVDDIVVLIITLFIFYEFAPKGLMEEHRQAVRNQIEAEWREASTQEEEIIDGQFQEDDNNNDQKLG